MARSTPFDLALSPIADERFPPVRDALERDGADPRDRDAFLLVPEAVQLVRDVRPDEGVGEAIDQLVAFMHHAYLFWAAGQDTVHIEPDALPGLLAHGHPDHAVAHAYYAQLPERKVWGEVVEGEPHEPLDGVFVHTRPEDGIRVLGVFGFHRDRAGFSVVETAGPRPAVLRRQDDSPLFGPVMPGGDAAGLHSIAGGEELLELGWRTTAFAPADAT